MKKLLKKAAVVLCCLMLVIPAGAMTAMADAAPGGASGYTSVSYDVIVAAPDNYVNFRYGPGIEYGIICPIYNGVVLHVSETAHNYYDGLDWGQVYYNGSYGWVSLSQTSVYAEPQTQAPTTAAEVQTQPQTQSSSSSASEYVYSIFHREVPVGTLIYEFSVPKINLDGDEIQQINEEIKNDFYALCEDGVSKMEAGTYMDGDLTQMSYEAYVNGDILSLVIYTAYAGPSHSYRVYNVSISNKIQLSAAEVYQAAGYTEQQYLERLKEVMGLCYWVENYHYYYDNYSYDQTYFDLQNQTVSEMNLSGVKPYLGETGDLCAAGIIYLYRIQVPETAITMNLEQDRPSVGYYVVVDAPDNYLNLRAGAGVSYSIITPIYNGKVLHITDESYNSSDGLWWGSTTYYGESGWVSLSQSTRVYPN